MAKRLDWSKANMPAPSDAIPRASAPSAVVYDERVRDNSAAQKQAELAFEDATLGEWFTAPEEFWAAWRKNSYPFKLAGFEVNKINGVWKVKLPGWVQKHVNAARAQAKKRGKKSHLAPSNRRRPF